MKNSELQKELNEKITITKRELLDMMSAVVCNYIDVGINIEDSYIEEIRGKVYPSMVGLLELRKSNMN